ncbi:MAG: glycosyltransferase [Bdellovibrionales bacterium]|nr:glycosyltransferase [Bdellovibrionales bacterium]
MSDFESQDSSRKPLISIVIPVFNEEPNIDSCYEALLAETSKLSQYQFEFIFTDNHSTDKTFNLLEKLVEKDIRVRAYRFSRNFGYQKSILTGYSLARGQAALQFDCDLQDPPELIGVFLDHWRKGAKVVYGIRKSRKEGFFITFLRKCFYKVIDKLSDIHIPQDAGDFRLVDRVILEELKNLDDADPYLRGTIAEAGYVQVSVPYDRRERKKGESKFNMAALWRLAFDGITNHSILPLRFATYIGLGLSLVTFFGLIGYAVAKLFFHVNWPAGFTTLTVLVLFSLSINALFLGILGEYVGRIYLQLKKRKRPIIESALEQTSNVSYVSESHP